MIVILEQICFEFMWWHRENTEFEFLIEPTNSSVYMDYIQIGWN